MSVFEQMPFGSSEFADNPEPRCPCLLLLDTSHSMSGNPIAQLNQGIQAFKDELATDALAMKRVEIAVVTFGPVAVLNDFQTPDHFYPAHLNTSGDTPLGEAIETGLSLLKQRKDAYKSNAISYYRPWVFLITDGAPTDDWHRAAELVKQGESSGAFSFFPIAVKGADVSILKQLSVREPLRLDGLKFRELFSWLSSSLSRVSQSQMGTKVALPAPAGWAEV
jgi:uncharacterized protein YegL